MFYNLQEISTLYDGCDVTRRESELLIMSLVLRHCLSDKNLQHILDLIDCHLPHVEYRSKYRFLKSFQYPKAIEYFYCKTCSLIVNFEDESSFCSSCNATYTKLNLKSEGNYFLYLPLEEQLINLLNSKIYDNFGKINAEESDVVHGDVYKQLREHNVIKDNDLSITWNTDGVTLCKSSKFSMWPLQVSINELPYRIRRRNIILCGLSYGITKPDMNVFLEPFAKELVKLAKEGLNTTTLHHAEPINIKVHAILCSVDSVARPLIQNVKQYNGAYGCSYCFQKGEHVHVGKGFARVYPYKRNVRKRSQHLHDKLVDLSINQNKTVKGVKGPSIMATVPNLNIVHSYPPEYMHSCVLGIGKLCGNEWFNSANSNEPWYLGSKAKDFDAKMLTIKPPCEITRTPQSIINIGI